MRFHFLENAFDLQKYKEIIKNFTISQKGILEIIENFFIFLFLVLILRVFFEDVSGSTLKTFLIFGTYFFGMTTISSLLKTVVLSTYRKIKKYEEDYMDNFILGFALILNTLFFSFLIYLSFELSNIDFTSFLTALSVIAVGLLWAFKDYIANFLDGFIIIFSNDFNVRDYIQIGEVSGKIKKITFFKTHIILDNGNLISISNTKFLNSDIINYSAVGYRRFLFSFEIDKKDFSQFRKLEKYLIEILKKNYAQYLYETRPPFLQIERIERDSCKINIEIPLLKHPKNLVPKLKRHISRYILRYLSK